MAPVRPHFLTRYLLWTLVVLLAAIGACICVWIWHRGRLRQLEERAGGHLYSQHPSNNAYEPFASHRGPVRPVLYFGRPARPGRYQ
ncbi:hypothetical protein GCM10023184_22150 [Flaviaesturariibacter amylovorans]|uniref:Secreted protein n=1 Tax=Flaviaesturariibacter amylovorans TaxID=1084520 RepID=A0ABP8GX92_9BACT